MLTWFFFLTVGHQGLLLVADLLQESRGSVSSNDHCLHGGEPLLRCHGGGTSPASAMLLITACSGKAPSRFGTFASDSNHLWSETCVQQVQDSSDVIKDGRVRVVFSVPHEPQLDSLIQNQHVSQTDAVAPKCFTTSCILNNPSPAFPIVFVEILRQVQPRIRPCVSPRHHQLPRVPLLREHFHWPRLQEEVSVQSPRSKCCNARDPTSVYKVLEQFLIISPCAKY